MTAGYEVKIFEGGRVIVVLHPGCSVAKEAILALLREAGVGDDLVTFVQPQEMDTCGNLEGVPVVIPVDAASCDAIELADAGRHGCEAGGHIVVVFDPALQYPGLHPIADKYGTQTDWSADHLRSCLGGGTSGLRTSNGEVVNRPAARQVKCG